MPGGTHITRAGPTRTQQVTRPASGELLRPRRSDAQIMTRSPTALAWRAASAITGFQPAEKA